MIKEKYQDSENDEYQLVQVAEQVDILESQQLQRDPLELIITNQQLEQIYDQQYKRTDFYAMIFGGNNIRYLTYLITTLCLIGFQAHLLIFNATYQKLSIQEKLQIIISNKNNISYLINSLEYAIFVNSQLGALYPTSFDLALIPLLIFFGTLISQCMERSQNSNIYCKIRAVKCVSVFITCIAENYYTFQYKSQFQNYVSSADKFQIIFISFLVSLPVQISFVSIMCFVLPDLNNKFQWKIDLEEEEDSEDSLHNKIKIAETQQLLHESSIWNILKVAKNQTNKQRYLLFTILSISLIATKQVILGFFNTILTVFATLDAFLPLVILLQVYLVRKIDKNLSYTIMLRKNWQIIQLALINEVLDDSSEEIAQQRYQKNLFYLQNSLNRQIFINIVVLECILCILVTRGFLLMQVKQYDLLSFVYTSPFQAKANVFSLDTTNEWGWWFWCARLLAFL